VRRGNTTQDEAFLAPGSAFFFAISFGKVMEAPGAGCFFFVLFAIFCADDFFFAPPALRRKKAKDIFEQKIAKVTKSHSL
jgi:hypothetical protein